MNSINLILHRAISVLPKEVSSKMENKNTLALGQLKIKQIKQNKLRSYLTSLLVRN